MCLRCSIHFCCTDQRPAGNSSKGIIQKKERRDEDQDVGDVAPNKLDGYPILVERTNKGKADTTSVKSGEKTQDCEKKKKKKKGLDIGVHFVQFAIEFGNVELLQRWTEMI